MATLHVGVADREVASDRPVFAPSRRPGLYKGRSKMADSERVGLSINDGVFGS